MPNPFKFYRRYALLTYSQCGDLDPFAVSDHLSALGAECIIGRESHALGGIHLHAFVDFGRQYYTSDARAFDVGGCHPNVAPPNGTPQDGYDYACKEGDIVAGGLTRPGRGSVPQSRDCWHEIVMAETRDDFFRLVRENSPRTLCTSFPSLVKYADWRYRVDPEPYRHDPGLEFNLEQFPELEHWSQTAIGQRQSVGKF